MQVILLQTEMKQDILTIYWNRTFVIPMHGSLLPISRLPQISLAPQRRHIQDELYHFAKILSTIPFRKMSFFRKKASRSSYLTVIATTRNEIEESIAKQASLNTIFGCKRVTCEYFKWRHATRDRNPGAAVSRVQAISSDIRFKRDTKVEKSCVAYLQSPGRELCGACRPFVAATAWLQWQPQETVKLSSQLC